METKFSPEEVIKLIEDFIANNNLNPSDIEIGSLNQEKLAVLLYSKNISKEVRLFECELKNIDKVIKYFTDSGLLKSKFSENNNHYIFLLY